MVNMDLTRTDTYERYNVPDRDMGVCLKVLRTVRNLCLEPNCFDPEGALLLSHAIAKLHEKIEQVMELEARGGKDG